MPAAKWKLAALQLGLYEFYLITMAWFPYQKYVLYSSLTSIQIKEKFNSPKELLAMPGSGTFKTMFGNPRNTHVFTGVLSRNSFKIKAHFDLTINGYRNAFRPEAGIKFTDMPYGTMNTVTIKPCAGTVIMMTIMIFFVLVAAIFVSVRNFSTDGFGKEPFIFLSLLFFMYIMSTAGFNSELKELTECIDTLLEVQ